MSVAVGVLSLPAVGSSTCRGHFSVERYLPRTTFEGDSVAFDDSQRRVHT